MELSWDRLTMVLVMSALAASTVTQIFKALFKDAYLQDSKVRRPLLRAISGICGAVFGWWLEGPMGIVIGIGAGGITTTVVAAIKDRIKSGNAKIDEDF
jgi:hypothetical protein